jgi:hypothetical protein
MTDRLKGVTVVFEKDIREDDAQGWIDASLRDLDPRTLDLDHLPKGVKWVTDAEWEDIEGRLVGQ